MLVVAPAFFCVATAVILLIRLEKRRCKKLQDLWFEREVRYEVKKEILGVARVEHTLPSSSPKLSGTENLIRGLGVSAHQFCSIPRTTSISATNRDVPTPHISSIKSTKWITFKYNLNVIKPIAER